MSSCLKVWKPHRGMDRLDQWATASELRANQAKCQVLPRGHSNPQQHSRLGEEQLEPAWGKESGGVGDSS